MNIQVLSGGVTRERVEQIRALLSMRMPSGKRLIVRTHKNAIAYDLLEFIDKHLPADSDTSS